MSEGAGRFQLRVASSADKDLARLPEKAAAAIAEFMIGALCENPHRVGKPLRGEQAGRYTARRGPYRVIYEIDEADRVVHVLHADHRADVYRRRS